MASSEDINPSASVDNAPVSPSTTNTNHPCISSSSCEPTTHHDNPLPSKRIRIKALAQQVTHGPKRLAKRLDILQPNEQSLDADDAQIANITDNVAFNVGNTSPVQDVGPKTAAQKTVGLFKRAGDLITRPEHTYKKAYANAMVASKDEFHSTEADAELLEADAKLREMLGRGPNSSLDDGVIEAQRQKCEKLQQNRDRRKVAWVTSKHVKRVRVVSREQLPFPAMPVRTGKEQGVVREGEKWLNWIGQLALYYSQDFIMQYVDDSDILPFERSALIQHTERLSVATSPLQSWLVDVYNVYCWKDVYCTSKWIGIYFTLWYFNYILTALYIYIIYFVITNRNGRRTMDQTRHSHTRVIDPSKKVARIDEAITKYGDNDWINPILDDLGPTMQLQLGDLADFAEILINFYEWRTPRATIYTLCGLAAMALFGVFVSVAQILRLCWLFGGLYFFIARPIASLNPRYRHVVSPFKWAFWNIPTHAEWAFNFLQCEMGEAIKDGAFSREASVYFHDLNDTRGADEKNVKGHIEAHSAHASHNVNDHHSDSRTLSFRGRWNNHTGRLLVSLTDISFISSTSSSFSPEGGVDGSATAALQSDIDSHTGSQKMSSPQWVHPYTNVLELRKCRAQSTTKLSFQNALSIVWQDGHTDVIEAMPRRDEAFNCIIGISSNNIIEVERLGVDSSRGNKKTTLRWQLVRTLPEDVDVEGNAKGGSHGSSLESSNRLARAVHGISRAVNNHNID